MQKPIDDTIGAAQADAAHARAVTAHVHAYVLAPLLALVLPTLAHGATRYVAETGADGPDCGLEATTACRSISQAIEIAAAGDRILVGPGRYGDLNRNGALGEPGEERGAPGCSCVLAVNKALIIVSSAGAAVTMIDGRSVGVQTVLLITVGREFGRPGKGFTVTETALNNGFGILVNSTQVMVRGNQVIFTGSNSGLNDPVIRKGIVTTKDGGILIEGNQVMNWYVGIEAQGNNTVRKNQVMYNKGAGIFATTGNVNVVGNVATANDTGIELHEGATARGNAVYGNKNGFFIGRKFGGVFTKNNMFANDCGLFNDGTGGLKATNNYWGATTGPDEFPPADRVCGEAARSTTTSPFATKPFAVEILKP